MKFEVRPTDSSWKHDSARLRLATTSSQTGCVILPYWYVRGFMGLMSLLKNNHSKYAVTLHMTFTQLLLVWECVWILWVEKRSEISNRNKKPVGDVTDFFYAAYGKDTVQRASGNVVNLWKETKKPHTFMSNRKKQMHTINHRECN